MLKVEHFQAAGIRVEAQRTDNGWHFYAWKPGTSQVFTDSTALAKWAWPRKTPTGDALRQWLAGLESAPEPEPEAPEPSDQTRTII